MDSNTRPGRPRRGPLAVLAISTLGATLALAACSSSGGKSPDAVGHSGGASTQPSFTGTPASSANPIEVGILYTDDNPLGVSPEIKDAADAAATYINAHGGMGGRTVKIVACNGQNNPQSDARCATQFVNSKVVTVYGLDGLWGGIGVSVLQKAGLVNQTLPISGPEFSAPNSYPWEGSGVTSASAAAAYASQQGGKAACVYVDVASFKEQCATYFGGVAKKLGVSYDMVAIPATANDVAQYATKVAGTGAKTVLIVSGGTVAQQMVNSAAQIGFKTSWILPSEQPDFLKAVGSNAKGLIFYGDLKSPDDPTDPDAALFRSVMHQYAPKAAYTSFSTMAFSNLMTLKAVADKAGGGAITRQNMPKLLDAINVKQFMGSQLVANQHLTEFPHAVHTGAYLYEWDGAKYVPAAKGYYQVPA
jgi:ABC-type branched-subunit amino acid transport system substrate-binding protein